MTDEIKKTVQPWIVSLGISVFCCAVFFFIMSKVVANLNETLDRIENRLIAIETRPPVTVPVPVPAPLVVQPAPGMPSVQIPTVDAPVSGSGSSANVPSAAPAPEAVAPVLPSVPPSAAPIEAPGDAGESNRE